LAVRFGSSLTAGRESVDSLDCHIGLIAPASTGRRVGTAFHAVRAARSNTRAATDSRKTSFGRKEMGMRSIVTAFAVAIVGIALFAGQVRADVILSNLPGTPSGTGTNLGLGTDLADRTKGVGLTTGALPLDFVSMTALISNTTPASVLSGGIFSDVAGNPGVQLAPFAPVPVPASTPASQISITTAAPFTLNPSTTYWFVLDGPPTTNSLLWQSLNPNVAPTPNGVSFVGYRFSSNGGTTWASSTIFNGMRIEANVVPEPASLGLLAGAGALLLRRRR
jgi:hypothetical protein